VIVAVFYYTIFNDKKSVVHYLKYDELKRVSAIKIQKSLTLQVVTGEDNSIHLPSVPRSLSQ